MQETNTHSDRVFLSQAFQLSIKCFHIWKLSLAYNNTIVALTLDNNQQKYIIYHYSQQKQLLNQTCLPIPFYTFSMIRDDEIILHSTLGSVFFFSLKSYTLKIFRQQYFSLAHQKTKKIFVFPETSLICIFHQSKTIAKETNTKLQYYHYKGQQQQCPLLESYQLREKGSTLYSHNLDSKSKIVWMQKEVHTTVMYIFELDGEMRRKVRTVDAGRLGSSLGKTVEEQTWRPVCQLAQNRFISVEKCEETAPFHIKYRMFRLNQKQEIWYLENDKHHRSVHKNSLEIYEAVLLKKNYAILVTEIDNGSLLSKINCQTGELQSQEFTQSKQNTNVKYYNVDWSDKYIIERTKNFPDDKSGERVFGVKIINVMGEVKDFYMMTLLQINEDFDDDFLQDCIELLTN